MPFWSFDFWSIDGLCRDRHSLAYWIIVSSAVGGFCPYLVIIYSSESSLSSAGPDLEWVISKFSWLSLSVVLTPTLLNSSSSSHSNRLELLVRGLGNTSKMLIEVRTRVRISPRANHEMQWCCVSNTSVDYTSRTAPWHRTGPRLPFAMMDRLWLGVYHALVRTPRTEACVCQHAKHSTQHRRCGGTDRQTVILSVLR